MASTREVPCVPGVQRFGAGWGAPLAGLSTDPGWAVGRLGDSGPGLVPAPHCSSPSRSLSTGRLTDLLLKAAFGTQAPDSGSTDSLQEKPMDIGGPTGASLERERDWGGRG